MKDPIEDLGKLIETLPPAVRQSVLEMACVNIGHSKADERLPREAGVARPGVFGFTADDLTSRLRYLATEVRLDVRFLVCGVLHDIRDYYASVESDAGRRRAIDQWLDLIGRLRSALSQPLEHRPLGWSDEHVQALLDTVEEGAALVPTRAAEATAICHELELAWTKTFDDDYWDEWNTEQLALGLDDQLRDEDDRLRE